MRGRRTKASFSTRCCGDSAGTEWTLCPKFGSDVKINDASTTARGMERFIVHITRLSGESRGGPKFIQNDLRARRGEWCGFYCG